MAMWPEGSLSKGHVARRGALHQPEKGSHAFSMLCGETEQAGRARSCQRTGLLSGSLIVCELVEPWMSCKFLGPNTFQSLIETILNLHHFGVCILSPALYLSIQTGTEHPEISGHVTPENQKGTLVGSQLPSGIQDFSISHWFCLHSIHQGIHDYCFSAVPFWYFSSLIWSSVSPTWLDLSLVLPQWVMASLWILCWGVTPILQDSSVYFCPSLTKMTGISHMGPSPEEEVDKHLWCNLRANTDENYH